MANVVYPGGLDAFGSALIDYTSFDIGVRMMKSTYTYSSSHVYLSDVFADSMGDYVLLTSKTVTAGEFFADDAVFEAVPLGPDNVSGLIVYNHTGLSSTSQLIAFIDTDNAAAPIDVEPNGGDITVAWPSNRVFKI